MDNQPSREHDVMSVHLVNGAGMNGLDMTEQERARAGMALRGRHSASALGNSSRSAYHAELLQTYKQITYLSLIGDRLEVYPCAWLTFRFFAVLVMFALETRALVLNGMKIGLNQPAWMVGSSPRSCPA